MLWTKALLSGEYDQGRINLWNKENDTYCCLGVLCDIHPEVKWEDTSNPEVGVARYGNDTQVSSVPITIALETGLEKPLRWWETAVLSNLNIVATTNVDTRQDALMSMNDSGGMSFNKIAAIIMLFGWDVEISEE